jgi:hypothetical protein
VFLLGAPLRGDDDDGVSVGFTELGGFGLLFNTVSDEGGLMADLAQAPFSLGDVIEALSMSTGAANCIASAIESTPTK